jgi:aryl-alcohol dehydrogenase-like predicted oxidoreductase
VQFNYSVTTREAEKRLLPLCMDKGVAVIVNRAFEDGDLFNQVKGVPLPAWAAEFGATSWAQVFLKFVLAHPAVTCVIPRRASSETWSTTWARDGRCPSGSA